MGTRIRASQAAIAIALLPSPVFAATAAYQALVASSNPILYYQFNEAAGAALNYGSLGHTYDATYFGAPTRQATTERGDSGVAFNSASDFLESTAIAPVGLTGNPTFSAEALFFVPTNGTASLWAPFLHWGPSPSGPDGKSVYFSFSHNDPTSAFAGFYDGGLKSTHTLPLGHWHHFVWVRTGGGTALVGTKVYIDGRDVTATLVPDPDLPSNGETPIVGATAFRVNRAQDFDGSRFFTGTLDEVALYDHELTAKEVLDHFYQAVDEIFQNGFQ